MSWIQLKNTYMKDLGKLYDGIQKLVGSHSIYPN